MDREQEIGDLKKRLESIGLLMQGELNKIGVTKEKLRKAYRRSDKEKYEGERKQITANLEAYGKEQEDVKKRIAELEAGTAA